MPWPLRGGEIAVRVGPEDGISWRHVIVSLHIGGEMFFYCWGYGGVSFVPYRLVCNYFDKPLDSDPCTAALLEQYFIRLGY